MMSVLNSEINKEKYFTFYVYTYPEHIESAISYGPFCGFDYALACKNGDTHQGLNDGLIDEESAFKRKDKQGREAEAFAKQAILSITIEKIPGILERDYDVHKILKKAGLRPTSGPRAFDGKGKEWFYLPFDPNDKNFETTKAFLKEKIASITGDLPRELLSLKLSQKEMIRRVIKKYDDFLNGRTDTESVMYMIASLCARFGKTIWVLSLFKELSEYYGHNVLILPAYVLSSHSSFEKEIKIYEEFRNMVFIDAYDGDKAKNQLKEALALGKLPVISVSMHARNHDTFEFIHQLDSNKKFIFIDEADKGAWTNKSREIVKYLSE
jgi:hypothetical protein